MIETIVEKEMANLAINILRAFDTTAPKDKQLTLEEKEQLKRVILKTKDVDMSCSALLNVPRIFTKDELPILRKLAYTTKNAHWAYNIYRNDWLALSREKGNRAVLTAVVVNTDDPSAACLFLREEEENRIPYKDDAKSLNFTDRELERFKQVIISSHDPQWSLYLLNRSMLLKESTIKLTPEEHTVLTRSIIESQNPAYAYAAFRYGDGLTKGERMVLKGIFMRTKDPGEACRSLCDTDFISQLDAKERAYLRQLAVQVENRFDADQALKYIYDLTLEERTALEKIAHK